MKIAQYYPWVYLKSGIERTILEIAKHSRHEHTVLTNHFDKAGTFPDFEQVRVVSLSRVEVRRSLDVVASAARTIALNKVDLDEFDAVLVHCDGLGDLFTIRNRQRPTFCFCHTPLRPCFDDEYFRRVSSRYSGMERIPFLLARTAFRVADRHLWREYKHVFFNSEETLRRARAGGLLTAVMDRHEITNPGLNVDEIQPSDEFEPFFLVPGRIMWTKNVEAAVAGFIKLKRDHPNLSPYRLVVAGHVDLKSEPYVDRLRRISACRSDIEYVVSPSDCRLHDLYRRCYATVVPAWCEDWGMVPLEANAFGKPVLASRRGGPLESQVDGVTGYLVEPTVAGFSEGLRRLAADPERVRRMGALARRRVAKYDWARTVSRIDDVLEFGVRAHLPRAHLRSADGSVALKRQFGPQGTE
jgi:glycosyltransferase involved in cell wall biosynthesis